MVRSVNGERGAMTDGCGEVPRTFTTGGALWGFGFGADYSAGTGSCGYGCGHVSEAYGGGYGCGGGVATGSGYQDA